MRCNRRILRSSPVLTLVTLLAAIPVGADVVREYSTHGASCQPAHGMYSHVAYGEPGIGNFSTAIEARVFCPIDILDERTPREYSANEIIGSTIHYADNSDTVPFWCYVWAAGRYGSQWWSPRRYTCSDPCGCSDPTTVFRGFGDLCFRNPFGASFSYATVGYSCSIPRVQRGSGIASWVAQMLTTITTYQ